MIKDVMKKDMIEISIQEKDTLNKRLFVLKEIKKQYEINSKEINLSYKQLVEIPLTAGGISSVSYNIAITKNEFQSIVDDLINNNYIKLKQDNHQISYKEGMLQERLNKMNNAWNNLTKEQQVDRLLSNVNNHTIFDNNIAIEIVDVNVFLKYFEEVKVCLKNNIQNIETKTSNLHKFNNKAVLRNMCITLIQTKIPEYLKLDKYKDGGFKSELYQDIKIKIDCKYPSNDFTRNIFNEQWKNFIKNNQNRYGFLARKGRKYQKENTDSNI